MGKKKKKKKRATKKREGWSCMMKYKLSDSKSWEPMRGASYEIGANRLRTITHHRVVLLIGVLILLLSKYLSMYSVEVRD